MNKKYERYIDYIVSDIEPQYFKNMRDQYGLRPDEYEMVLSKLFNQPITIKNNSVYDELGNIIYYENISDGYWEKKEYDAKGKIIYFENSNDYWEKYEYDELGNVTYLENNEDYWEKYEYDELGNKIYSEDSYGNIGEYI